MHRGGGGRYRNRGGSYSRGNRSDGQAQAVRLPKGLFADGIWMCNCTPRLPAEHFKVKKEGKNQGRWFYTCQQADPKRCDFFLWDEDAKPREEAAVLNNRRSESGVQEGWDAARAQRAARTDAMGAQDNSASGKGLFAQSVQQVNRQNGGKVLYAGPEETDSPTPSPVSHSPTGRHSATANSGTKRTARDAGIDENDDYFPWPLTGQEEQEMVRSVDVATETPRKMQRTDAYLTPGTTGRRKLPWLELESSDKNIHLATPSKRTSTVSSTADPSVQTPKASSAFASSAVVEAHSPPTRFKDGLHDPADSESSLTNEALAALAPATLPNGIRDAVRSVLSKHDLKMQGIIRGRDISRLAIKAKDAKIAELGARIAGLDNAKVVELQARITSLEADRELDKAIIRQLRWQLEHGQVDEDTQETIG
ncbi:hypothetical protein BAUCODRAFT_36923 [Baudoinia panamericana UAMH 10762]|uniref:GRF-type domain-containing protein n=1 Tax=Baudoinia panamericana (strain UAMH 10762) TaxID=717646 RepID=M2N3E8_BAUPA|nr:uncharacterized protein BAUCODRAFT_36923 [Baudoinia panamericana UAMH 10762]EMC93250.1 hypothetical protein BAUCODRAFT_36923 [Baudoinia panamericana UAMH 10762]